MHGRYEYVAVGINGKSNTSDYRNRSISSAIIFNNKRKGGFMTFDGIFTKWMMDEVAPQLVGGRITKIHQPLPYDVQFTIRANRKNYLLVCSAQPMMARVQFYF